MFDIQNRRYTGSKYKLLGWIKELIDEHCTGDIFFDVFGGTGVVTNHMLEDFKTLIINDFLFSNEVIYNAFFGKEGFDIEKLRNIRDSYKEMNVNTLPSNYATENYGDKFFSIEDATAIGFIREDLMKKENIESLNKRERDILLASLLYSADRIANTVGHYDAYFKGRNIKRAFEYNLINPAQIGNADVQIYRRDANELVKEVKSDVAFIDPPYNSRQYSRFYHVLENITKWEMPELSGVAMKPPVENMSDFCRKSAPAVFDDLIQNLDTRFIVVTYNNNYNGKSSSSTNKISLEQIEESLNKVGKTNIYNTTHQFFNAGKTEFDDHKEYVFITEVNKNE